MSSAVVSSIASSFGRISSVVLVSSQTGGVILARFYDPQLEQYKREVLRDFLQAADVENLVGSTESQEDGSSECYTSLYQKHNLVFQRISDVVVFCSGTKDQSHARVAKVIENFVFCLIEGVLKKSITEDRIIKNYAKVCLLLDEILNEGIVQTLDTKLILKQLKL